MFAIVLLTFTKLDVTLPCWFATSYHKWLLATSYNFAQSVKMIMAVCGLISQQLNPLVGGHIGL